MCDTCGCGEHEHDHDHTHAVVEKVLKVNGMTCQHCVMAVQKSVTGLQGVKYAVVDLGAGTVKVSFDEGQVSLHDIKHKIEEAGYQPVD